MSRPIRVLIIEDSENDALLVVRRLQRSGFDPVWKRVQAAESLREAGIVKQHQGWIEVESAVGRGTTFNVFLPASFRAAASPWEPICSVTARGRGETILIAEDEPALRRLAARILRNLGYQVLEAGSGVEAINVWEQHGKKVDLLLTDLVMPDGLTGR